MCNEPISTDKVWIVRSWSYHQGEDWSNIEGVYATEEIARSEIAKLEKGPKPLWQPDLQTDYEAEDWDVETTESIAADEAERAANLIKVKLWDERHGSV